MRNLTPKSARAAWPLAALLVLADLGATPAPAAGAPPAPASESAAPTLAPAAPSAAGTASAAYLIRLRGRALYERFDGREIGVPDAVVYADDYKEENRFTPLGHCYTDADGYFDETFSFTPEPGHSLPSLGVTIEPKNNWVTVHDHTGGTNFARIESDIEWDYGGTDLNFGWMYPEEEQDNPAWHVFVNANRVRAWIGDNVGDDLPAVTIRTNYDSPYVYDYNVSTTTIIVGRDHVWHEPSLARAFGLFWLDFIDSGGTFGAAYCNDTCDPGGAICFHCDWCAENPRVAWVEGLCAFLADRFSADYEDAYGYAPLHDASFESLDRCGDDTYHDPASTEGYFAALLRDIADITMDNHPEYPDYRDVVSLGALAAFAGIRGAEDFTPLDFLKEMSATYPAYCELLWETGMNCGYDCDELPPPTATGLTSPTHPVGAPSTDSTPLFTWTRPADDASGIAGYSYAITATPSTPDMTADLEDVTSFTSAPLAPGTYYFNLRSLDRAGHWSSTSARFGPFTVLPPLPADLVFYQEPNWDYPLIPSGTTGNTSGEAHVSTTLPGNAASTYWNLKGWNVGESITEWNFRCYPHVDGVPMDYATWSGIGPDEGFHTCNEGPLTVRGGRHCFTGMVDELDTVSETNETNNVWGRQFVWTGRTLTTGTAVTRDAPPGHLDGWNEVTSGVRWYDCDGLNFTSTGYWNAVAVWALDAAEDYDCRLHAESTGAENGYAANIGISYRPAGWLDAVLVNRRLLGQDDYDVGVVNRYGGVGQYRAIKVVSQGCTFGDSSTIILSANQYLRMLEFNVTSNDTGYVSMTAKVDPVLGPVRIAWFDPAFATGGLADAAQEQETGADGWARIDVHIGDPGYQCLALFRNPEDGSDSVPVIIEFERTPPDLEAYEPAGWHSPFVPRPLADGAPGGVAAPDTLHGNAAATYLNLCSHNAGPTAAGSSRLRTRLDGEAWISILYTSYAGGGVRYYNSASPRTVRGGRHTVDMFADADGALEEMHEDNNIYGEQYVWSPLPLAAATPAARGAPPLATAGWDRVTSGEARYYNCDGLRLPQAAGWWKAVAVMPDAGTNVDLRAHAVAGGAKNGFRANLGLSAWGPGDSDFVLVNFNETAQAPYDFGVLNHGAGGAYTAESAVSTYLGTAAGTFGPYTLPANGIVRLYEFRLSPGFYGLRLDNVAGGVDWGVSVFPPGDPYLVKSEAMDGAAAWLAGAGAGEAVHFEVAGQNYYCVAVWKRGSADLAQAGSYRLVLFTGFTDVPDDDRPLAVTRLVGAQPNPFNPCAGIVFELAQAGEVRLAVYDLQGKPVRVLLAEPRPAGRHRVTWDGCDESGRRAASGVYVARLESGGARGLQKLTLLK